MVLPNAVPRLSVLILDSPVSVPYQAVYRTEALSVGYPWPRGIDEGALRKRWAVAHRAHPAPAFARAAGRRGLRRAGHASISGPAGAAVAPAQSGSGDSDERIPAKARGPG